ncbi:MAG: hypothetical protein IJD48_01495, partial [Clostridia bacterium]|nr:hypothetical protein [Clostridia bacterium]
DLFRRQAESSFISGSFSQLKEVIFESGLSQEEIASGKYEPTTLPSKPFLRSEIEFIKFDGHQIIPQNFLINVSRVENIICPDNNNTHDFVQTYINDKYINLVLTQTDNQGFAEETSQSDTE